MALVDADLKSDLTAIMTDPHPVDSDAAAAAWASAVDDWWVDAQSNAITVAIPGSAKSTMQTVLETALVDGSAAGVALGLKDALLAYFDSCTFGSGTCDPVDDPTGATFQATMGADFLVLSSDASAKGNSIGAAVATFGKSFKGNFPPPDPNFMAIT